MASWVSSAACAAAAADAEVGGAPCCSWFYMASMSSSSEPVGDLTVWLLCGFPAVDPVGLAPLFRHLKGSGSPHHRCPQEWEQRLL